ncbi:MAG TPA: M28 family peptidase, partial [Candidatus Polarisedimenticolia bacterium]|nr:M28 family peptidase [Candidatus Polarisedimenticolia bacterium]
MGAPARRVRAGLRILLAIVVAGEIGARLVETRRIARPLAAPRSAAAAPRLDSAALLADVQALASPEFEGRRADSDGGRRARAFVLDRFERLGLDPAVPGYVQPFSFTHRSVRALLRRDRPFALEFKDNANVLGLVRGKTDPDRFLLVSAHYDHLGIRRGDLYPGADDNASGVAALLGFAAWFATHPPEHTVVLAAFDAEEEGCRGSEAFAQAPPLPLDRMVV